MSGKINQRKSEHIDIVLKEQITGENISTGFENYIFKHNALPEIDFSELKINSEFLGDEVRTPFLISSMTGGAEFAETINRNFALAAEERGWALALGSSRALIESTEHHASFQLRKYAPTIPIIANLGAVQLNYGFGVEQCKQILHLTEANALVLHLNSIQEVIQPEGNTNFKSLLGKIEALCRGLAIPVGVKEVGWGIDGMTAQKLANVGVSFIDVAGAGGTSWSQVEKFRSTDVIKKDAANVFAEWGIPTTDCIASVKAQAPNCSIIASGGIHTGLEAAKAISLGAHMVGFGRSILKEATHSVEAVLQAMETRELELRMTMFGIGALTIDELKHTNRLIKKNLN